MTRHSKNINAAGFFSASERARFSFVTTTGRIAGESNKPFDGCYLCLQRAVDPMACGKGHLFCRECILENILTQKSLHKRRVREFEQAQTRILQQQEQSRLEGEAAALERFCRQESSDPSPEHGPPATIKQLQHSSPDKPPEPFQASCPAGRHSVSLRCLHRVSLKYPAGSQAPVCPICTKELSNSTKCRCFLDCGHVVCKRCAECFREAPGKCPSCGQFQSKDSVEMQTEGTGFSALGNSAGSIRRLNM